MKSDPSTRRARNLLLLVVATVAVRTGVPAGSVFLGGAHLQPGPVEIESAVAVR